MSVSHFVSVNYGEGFSKQASHKAMEWVDKYLYLGGKHVTIFSSTQPQGAPWGCICDGYDGYNPSTAFTVFKIISYCTLVFPLIVFTARLFLRYKLGITSIPVHAPISACTPSVSTCAQNWPPEVIEGVMSFLDEKDAGSLSQTSRYYHGHIQSIRSRSKEDCAARKVARGFRERIIGLPGIPAHGWEERAYYKPYAALIIEILTQSSLDLRKYKVPLIDNLMSRALLRAGGDAADILYVYDTIRDEMFTCGVLKESWDFASQCMNWFCDLGVYHLQKYPALLGFRILCHFLEKGNWRALSRDLCAEWYKNHQALEGGEGDVLEKDSCVKRYLNHQAERSLVVTYLHGIRCKQIDIDVERWFGPIRNPSCYGFFKNKTDHRYAYNDKVRFESLSDSVQIFFVGSLESCLLSLCELHVYKWAKSRHEDRCNLWIRKSRPEIFGIDDMSTMLVSLFSGIESQRLEGVTVS
jgi:hypothetical protein